MALHNLGCLYFAGKGCSRDPRAAARWFSVGARVRSARALHALACCYVNGDGVQQARECPLPCARKRPIWATPTPSPCWAPCMRPAAARTVDERKAVELFRRSADNGSHNAMFTLGRCYAMGFGGLPRDEAEMERWFRRAAELGNESACELLRVIDQQRAAQARPAG